jgi:hypothetical protein
VSLVLFLEKRKKALAGRRRRHAMRRKRAKPNKPMTWAQPVGVLRHADPSARTALNEPKFPSDAEKRREFMKC